jgi:hypothetical protein
MQALMGAPAMALWQHDLVHPIAAPMAIPMAQWQHGGGRQLNATNGHTARTPGRPDVAGEHHFAPPGWGPAFVIVAATVVTLLGGWLVLTVPLLLFVPRRHVLLP